MTKILINESHHTGKEDVLNSKQCKELNTFLSKEYRKTGINNWKYLLMSWNSNNSHIEIPEDYPKPDYSIIELK